MTTYLVVGGASVAGHTVGETVTDEELAGANITALIEGGHVVEFTSTTTEEHQ